MRPWSTEQPARSEGARPRRVPGMPAPSQDPSQPGRPATGPMNRGAQPPSGDWAAGFPPFNNQAPPTHLASPSGIMAHVSRPLAGKPPEPLPHLDVMQPSIPLSRFGRATGLSLKLRFLLALTLLSLAPAFLLVLLYQQANQSSLTRAGQQALLATAQTDSNVLAQELANRQAHLASLAQQTNIAQANPQQAESLLREASRATPDSIAWMVLNGSDRITASTLPDIEGQALASTTLLAHPAVLGNFVQEQRQAASPAPLPVAVGPDEAIADKAWVATLAFVSPKTPARSSAILAVFSLPKLVSSYLSPFSSSPTSYVGVFDTQGTILGVVGNEQLAQQIGQPLPVEQLRNMIQTLQTDQGNTAQPYHDLTTDKQETAAGAMNKDLGIVFLAVAPLDDLAPPTTGLLEARNLPLIFLSIIVVTTLAATWVALPIVRPIRRATREILASTDDVRLLAEQAKQIAKDQRLGTDILEGAAKGLDMRRRAIGRDAGLIANSSTAAATRLAQLAHTINELPESFQAPMQMLTREIYQELQTAHQLATGISSGLESDPVQKRLGNVMEGAAEISQQFEQASQQLQQGASRLERAAETLQ